MPDNPGRLIAGLYSNKIGAYLGFKNVADPTKPARSNATSLGLSTLTDGALAATGVVCSVPVGVEVGDVIAKVIVPIGATAAGTPTQSFAALYSGIATPALLGQSASGGAAAIAASAAFTFTLEAPVTITEAMAPNGFIYASVAITATTVPTAAAISTPTAVGYQWSTKGPLGFSLTHGSAVGATAPATITGQAAKAVAPVVLLV